MIRPAIAALAAILISVTSSVPAGALDASVPALGNGATTARLPLGGLAIVRPMPAVPVAAIELWYRAPAIGFGPQPVPGLARLAAQTVVESVPLTGTPLSRAVSEAGGRVTTATYPNSIAISALVPADRAPAIVRAMTAAFFAPVVTADGLRSAGRAVGREADLRDFLPDDAVRDALFAALFTDGPDHFAGLGTSRDLAGLSLETVRSFATRAFRAQNATLIVTGAVDPTVLASAVEGRPESDGALTGPEPMLAATPAPAPSPLVRDAGSTGIGWAWAGPPIASEREATAMDFIADALCNSDTGSLTKALAPKDASVACQFVTYHDPGVLVVSLTGTDAATVKPQVDAAFAALTSPMPTAAFTGARNAFVYHILSDLETPISLADNFGWYSVEGNLGYAPGAGGPNGAYFAAAQSLTPAFVAEVARKYLGKPGATVTLRERPPLAIPTPKATPSQ